MTGPSSVRHCAVLGSPIAHSLSPVLHTAAYDALGLTGWAYDAVEVDEAGLASYVGGLDASWRGLSLTMPLKRAVLPLLDEVSPVVERAGAANTVLLGEGGLRGDNTDVPGAVAAVRERWHQPVASAVVVGGGATAASMLVALADLGCHEVTLLVREPSRVKGTLRVAERLPDPPKVTVQALSGPPVTADAVVSTVPGQAQTPDLLDRVAEVPLVFEVVYDGWPTPLARAAGDRTLVSGLDLLVHQAALQVDLMTEHHVDDGALAAMRAAGETALAAR